MAEVVIPVNYGSCAMRMLDSAEGKITSWTFGYHLATLPTAIENAQSIRDAAIFTGSICAPPQYAAATYLESVYVLEHVSGGFRSAEVAVHQVGTRGGSAVAPPQTALGLRKRTEFVGKTRRGRIYLPAMYLLTSDYLESGRVGDTRLSTINAAAAIFLTQLGLGAVPMRLLHTAIDLVPDDVLTLTAAPILRTQRRRLPRS